MFGRQLRFNLSKSFPLVTTKRVHFKSVAVELLWFLRGDSGLKMIPGEVRDTGNTYEADVLVVGGGPAGLEAARVAAFGACGGPLRAASHIGPPAIRRRSIGPYGPNSPDASG